LLFADSAGPDQFPPIAVIDDDAAVRESLGIVLRRLGRPVRIFGTAEDFFAASQDVCPACVVMDINLPGMCGWSAIRALREAGCESPVVAISGRRLHSDEALARGATAALEKPLSPGQLLDTLRDCLTSPNG